VVDVEGSTMTGTGGVRASSISMSEGGRDLLLLLALPFFFPFFVVVVVSSMEESDAKTGGAEADPNSVVNVELDGPAVSGPFSTPAARLLLLALEKDTVVGENPMANIAASTSASILACNDANIGSLANENDDLLSFFFRGPITTSLYSEQLRGDSAGSPSF
jgi:hypothetical protein